MIYWFQVYNTVVFIDYTPFKLVKILAIFPVLYNISL